MLVCGQEAFLRMKRNSKSSEFESFRDLGNKQLLNCKLKNADIFLFSFQPS